MSTEEQARAGPASLDEFRERYRRLHIGPRYRGRLHFAFTGVVCLGVITACILQLRDVTPLEWLAIPLTFLYANVVEYFGHCGPMHHPRRGLRLVFERHAQQHHRFFTDDRMQLDSTRDFKAVLFPPVLIIFYLGFFAIPMGIIVALITTPNVALLFVATAVGYFLNYELLHFAYHTPDGTWIARIPFMDRLRRLHTLHHRRSLMQNYNFNITYPICDRIFGTLYHGDRDAS